MAGGDVGTSNGMHSGPRSLRQASSITSAPPAAGQSAKAVNQLIVAGIAEAVCEALALMDRLDLPREMMLELLSGGAAGNWFLDKRGRTMLADEFEVGFEPALLLKDLKICKSLCEDVDFESGVLELAIPGLSAAGRSSGTRARYLSADPDEETRLIAHEP